MCVLIHMSGWIYCITNSIYKMDDIYKLGYTSNKQTIELVKQHLFQRYGTYFPDVECIDLSETYIMCRFKKTSNKKNSNSLFSKDIWVAQGE